MTTVLAALKSVQLGKSVAEKDECLKTAFVETSAFHNLMNNNYDIIEGDKGAGKTALFVRILSPEAYDQRPSNAIIVRGCNVNGEPFFQRLAEGDALSENEYIRFWKGYILARAGNWLLKNNKYSKNSRSSMYKLEQLLRGLDLYYESGSSYHDQLEAKEVFEKVLNHIASLFRWKSLAVSIDVGSDGGLSFSPKIDFAKDNNEEKDVSIDKAFDLLEKCLSEMGKSIWVAIDRLDEAFQGFPDAEIPALRGMFRTYRDLDEYKNITLKIFVRRDLFARIIKGGFVNLTHINSSKLTLKWEEEDLKTIICNRIRQNSELCDVFDICHEDNNAVIARFFPSSVTTENGSELAWPWIMSRVRDGNGAKSPRNLIDLVKLAVENQELLDSRDERDLSQIKYVVEEASLLEAARLLSNLRLEDTLLAEYPADAAAIKIFKGSGSVHTRSSIYKLFSHIDIDVDDKIQRLVFLGFLEERGIYYNIPHLYKGGLEIESGYDKGVLLEPVLANDQ